MKKWALLVTLLVAALAVSCKKENPAQPSSYDWAVCTVTLGTDKLEMVAGGESYVVPAEISAQMLVAKTPLPATLTDDTKLSCEPDGIILCELLETGVRVTPQSLGTATFTLTPTTYIGDAVSCKVTVGEVPPEPQSVSIIKTDSHFHTDGQLYLLEGDSFTFSAIVTSNHGSAMAEKVNWSVVDGTTYASIDAQSGKLTSKTLGAGVTSATAKVRATVDGHTDITADVTVKIQPLVKSVSISTSNFLNADNDLITKKGDIRKFRYSVQPTGAYDDIEVVLPKESKVSASRDGSDIVLTMSNTSSPSSTTVTLRSQKNPGASLSFNVFIFDYDANDVKVGDYVYCADGSFTTTDCGLRYVGSDTNIYVDANGCRTDIPRGILSYWSSFYIGVIASTQTPSLGCLALRYCANKDCEGNLYQYRNFYASDLPGIGLASTHCLVLRKNYSSSPTKWQNQGEQVSITTDTKNDISQSQLSRYLAFSQKSMNEGYTYKSGGNTSHGDFTTYNKCGFVPHMLLAFYSAHLNNVETFKVRPVLEINNYSDAVPKFSGEGSKTTGWFLPGEAEWVEIMTNYKIVTASLSASGGTTFPTGQYFWSTEETGETSVRSYKVVSGGLSIESRTKTDTAYTRAVLYL